MQPSTHYYEVPTRLRANATDFVDDMSRFTIAAAEDIANLSPDPEDRHTAVA
jgi:hypothetical protein